MYTFSLYDKVKKNGSTEQCSKLKILEKDKIRKDWSKNRKACKSQNEREFARKFETNLVRRVPRKYVYYSGRLVLSYFGTCMFCKFETNLSWTCLVSGLLSFESPSALLLYFCSLICYIYLCVGVIHASITKMLNMRMKLQLNTSFTI